MESHRSPDLRHVEILAFLTSLHSFHRQVLNQCLLSELLIVAMDEASNTMQGRPNIT